MLRHDMLEILSKGQLQIASDGLLDKLGLKYLETAL